jgi:beta-lactam-binding protein with PASTA domain
MRTPALINKSLSAVEQLLKPHGIRNKMYELPSSSALAGHCIGQFPAPNVPLDEKKVITYCAAEKNTLVLLPKFKQKPVTAVTEFLDGHTIKYTLSPSASSKNHACCEACVVTDQRPLAYSIISVGKQANPVQVHLQVHHAG